MKKLLPLIPITVLALVLGYSQFRSSHPSALTAVVKRGPIVQEVLASGNVASPSTISLQFQSGGKLSSVSVATGDTVVAGAVLARLDSAVLQAQLQQAQAALLSQQAQLASVQQGTRSEQLAVTDAQIASDKSALTQADRAIINAIQSAYTQADDAVINKADQLFSNQHTANPQLSFSASNSQLASTVLSERVSMESLLGDWQQSFSQLTASGDLAGAAADAQEYLGAVSRFLSDSNALLSSAIINQQASQTTVAGWLASVATARSSVNGSISSLTSAITVQQAAASALDKDQKMLALQQAGSTQSSIDAQKALVAQAQANVAAIQAQLAQAQLIAPVNGTVTNVNGDVGETVSPQSTVVTMIPDKKLQIDVNLSEDGVAHVRPGNRARITLDAFPGEEMQGVVTSVDPAQTIVGGAVYYKTTVVFNAAEEGVRPGMTANVWIQTGASQNALLVPASALRSLGQRTSVEVLHDGATQTRSVTTGLRGQDGMIEILSGLAEGESVVTATQ